MGIRNHRPDLNGILAVDKPLGLTSATVCAIVRRTTRGAKVGHAGTLDPLATGLLVLCLGRATKAIPVLMDHDKEYLAEIDLAGISETDDAEGARTPVSIDTPPTIDRIRSALDEHFRGEILQRPPIFSAIKVGGERSYRLARSGTATELKARPIRIHEIEILAYDWPMLTLRIRCSKGTYIRSIARNLGERLGTGGMLAGLRRTRSGPFSVEQAWTVDRIRGGIEPGDLMDAGEFVTHPSNRPEET